ncbi:MAG: c-type cytochrome [Saprospiraceae bacterium]|nr:c-type cytochrome [Saprospiraceae bacterium]
MIYKQFINYLLLTITFVMVTLSASAQGGNAEKGKSLFLGKCASCHNTDMKTKSTGPALAADAYGVNVWLEEYSQEDLYAWIRNSSKMVKAGHPRATKIYTEFNNQLMTSFPDLTDDDLASLVLYIQEKGKGGGATPQGDQGGDAVTASNTESSGISSTWLWVLFGTLFLAVVLLARYINNLNRLAQRKTGDEIINEKSILEIVFSRGVVRSLIFFGVLFGGYMLVNGAIGLGRQQGYAPDQPIKFSHELHAGNLEIDCQYCHDGARRSKHAVIPATNTCMNCHKAVQIAGKYNKNPRTGEIMKIYASAGFNPLDGIYFHDSIGKDERLAVYDRWANQKMKDKYAEAYDASEERFRTEIAQEVKVAAQYIKTKDKNTSGKPIEWIRIHNLQDHAYFNHSQHVVAGKIECQTCHGEVEKMEVVKQYAPLSMGWCVNCHRQTKVQFDNEYYSNYKYYHDELKSGKRKGVTVEDIGGLECQKCHY